MATANSLGSDNVEQDFEKTLSTRSKKIVQAMDTDGDGVISYQEAAKYGKMQENDIKKWKCLFVILFFLLLLIFGVIFGLFILGFELTKQIDVNNNNTVHNTNGLTISNGENLITTVTGTQKIDDILQYWDDKIDTSTLIVRYIQGTFYTLSDNDNDTIIKKEYIHATISYFTILYSPIEKMYLYDNSGHLKFELYKNINDTINGYQFILYQTLSNGTKIVKVGVLNSIANNVYADNDESTTQGRRLQACDCTTTDAGIQGTCLQVCFNTDISVLI